MKQTIVWNANKWAAENAERFPPTYDAQMINALAAAFEAGAKWERRRAQREG